MSVITLTEKVEELLTVEGLKKMKKMIVGASALAALVSLIVPLASMGLDGLDKIYDWTVEIETQKLEREFEYQGSTLKPVVKAEIKYWKESDEDSKTDYETAWFHDGKALGLERKEKFNCDEGDGIAIKVKHKTDSPTNEEMSAAANAINRIFLDAYIHKNSVVTVIVKDSSYNQILMELYNQHWEDQPDVIDGSVDSQINLHIRNESNDQKKDLRYQV